MKKTKGIIIAIVVIIIVVIAGIFGYQAYAKSQRTKINNELTAMNTEMITTKKNFNHKDNGKEDIAKMTGVVEANLEKLKTIQESSFNTDEMKAKESKMIAAFNASKSLMNIGEELNTIATTVKNGPKLPTPDEANQIIKKGTAILEGQDLANVKSAENNHYFTDVWGNNKGKDLKNQVDTIVSGCQKVVAFESLFGIK